MTTTTDRLGKNKMGMAKIKMESQQSMLLDIAIQMGKIMNNERCFCISRSRGKYVGRTMCKLYNINGSRWQNMSDTS